MIGKSIKFKGKKVEKQEEAYWILSSDPESVPWLWCFCFVLLS